MTDSHLPTLSKLTTNQVQELTVTTRDARNGNGSSDSFGNTPANCCISSISRAKLSFSSSYSDCTIVIRNHVYLENGPFLPYVGPRFCHISGFSCHPPSPSWRVRALFCDGPWCGTLLEIASVSQVRVGVRCPPLTISALALSASCSHPKKPPLRVERPRTPWHLCAPRRAAPAEAALTREGQRCQARHASMAADCIAPKTLPRGPMMSGCERRQSLGLSDSSGGERRRVWTGTRGTSWSGTRGTSCGVGVALSREISTEISLEARSSGASSRGTSQRLFSLVTLSVTLS